MPNTSRNPPWLKFAVWLDRAIAHTPSDSHSSRDRSRSSTTSDADSGSNATLPTCSGPANDPAGRFTYVAIPWTWLKIHG